MNSEVDEFEEEPEKLGGRAHYDALPFSQSQSW